MNNGTPLDNFKRNIGEITRFIDYIFNLEAGLKLRELVDEFEMVYEFWDLNHQELKNSESFVGVEFNQKMNSFYRNKVEEIKRYIGINAESLFDHKDVICRQLFVMIVSALEIYLDQQFRKLLKTTPLIYFRKIDKENKGALKDISLEYLNKCDFDIHKLGEILLNEGRLRYSFQNLSSIQEQFNRFGIELPIERSPDLEFYFDVRHVLVHKLGKFDRRFQEKYEYDFGNQALPIDIDLIKKMIKNISFIVEKIDADSKKIINTKILKNKID